MIKSEKNFIVYCCVVAYFLGSISLGTLYAADSTSSSTRYLENKIKREEINIVEMKTKVLPLASITHSLRRHASGDDVKTLQLFLRINNLYVSEEPITGYFGPYTEQSVKKFQKQEGIDPLGIVGPKTRAKMVMISKDKIKKSETATTTSTSTNGNSAEIVQVVLSSSLLENGSSSISETRFASTTSDIYATLLVKNASQNTKLSYIRLFENKYIDSKVTHPSRSGITFSHFQWSQKPGVNRIPGTYSLIFYSNDIKAQEVIYTIY